MRTVWRGVRYIWLLVFRPQRFIEVSTEDDIASELERNDQLRAQHPDGVLPPDKKQKFEQGVRSRTRKIRHGLIHGLGYVAATVTLAWLTGLVAHFLTGPAPPWLNLALQLTGAALLLGATLSLLGWEIQSIKGDTLPERVNRWIFRTLYVIGSYLLLLSIFWSAGPGNQPTGTASIAYLLQVPIESTYLLNLGITLFGTFVGVLTAFWVDHRRQEARAMRGYANTLNSIRADLSNLWVLCRRVSETLAKGRGLQSIFPLESPALDAALVNPAFYDRVPYGLVTSLIVLSNARREIQSALEKSPAPSDVDPGIKKQVDALIRTIVHVQSVLDDEVKPLGKPIIRTPRDVQVIDGLKQARRGQDGQTRSDS